MRLYLALLSYRQAYGIEVDHNMSIATVVLSFGLVEAEERHSLIDRFFSDFDLYAHWTFVLLASAWTAVWDTMLSE